MSLWPIDFHHLDWLNSEELHPFLEQHWDPKYDGPGIKPNKEPPEEAPVLAAQHVSVSVDSAANVIGNNDDINFYSDFACILVADKAPPKNIIPGAACMLASSTSFDVLDLFHNRCGNGNKKMLIEAATLV